MVLKRKIALISFVLLYVVMFIIFNVKSFYFPEGTILPMLFESSNDLTWHYHLVYALPKILVVIVTILFIINYYYLFSLSSKNTVKYFIFAFTMMILVAMLVNSYVMFVNSNNFRELFEFSLLVFLKIEGLLLLQDNVFSILFILLILFSVLDIKRERKVL